MHTGATPRDTYAERLAARTQRLQSLTRSRDRLGNLRLLVALGGPPHSSGTPSTASPSGGSLPR